MPNKLTSDVKEAIVQAFDRLGGPAYLEQVGKDNPVAFCTLLGKLLPHQLTGKDGQPLAQPTINVQLSEPGPAATPKAGNGASHPRH